jgi:hypothetical protein
MRALLCTSRFLCKFLSLVPAALLTLNRMQARCSTSYSHKVQLLQHGHTSNAEEDADSFNRLHPLTLQTQWWS